MQRFDAPLPSLPPRKIVLWLALAFFAASFLVYGQSLRHDFVGWDDGMLVYNNPAVQQITPTSVKWVFTHFDPELYIPLTFLTYQFDYAVGGGSALPFHLGNIILHTLNALLAVWALYSLSGKRWLALACGAVFLLHPLNTEAVDWVSARKDTLSTFFFLASLLLYLRWRDNPWPKTMFWSVACFALALMAKVMAVTLPVILIGLDLAQGRRLSWQLIKEKVWYLVLAVPFGLIAVAGKTEVLESSPPTTAVLMAVKSSVFYIQKLFWPFDFSVIYPFTGKIAVLSLNFGIPILVVVALAVVAFLVRRQWPELLYGLVFYVVTLVPTFSNIAKGGELDLYFASDRYAYIPQIGLLYAVFSGIGRLLESRPGVLQKTAAGVFAVLCVFCASLSYVQAQVWRNTESLFGNVIRLYPVWAFIAHNNLGNAYRLQGKYDKAIEELQKSVDIRPHPRTLSNLGAVYRKLGNFDMAMQQYEKALALSDKSPDAHFGLGIVYAQQGRYDDAIREYNRTLELSPRYEEAYSNRGAAELAQGKKDDALRSFQQALVINPFFVEARFNEANTLNDLGRTDQAIAELRKNTQMNPAHIPTRINLGLLLYNSGDKDGARAQFEAILRFDPRNATAKKALAQIGS